MEISMARERKKGKGFLIAFIVMFILVAVGIAVYIGFQAESITYAGNSHYSDEEMTEKIFGKDKPNVLLYKLFGNKKKTIPFIQKYDVEIQWPKKMYITVYEKPVIGYIRYMGCNMFFDKDGIVVESDAKLTEGVPEIKGLHFDHIVMHEQLPVENPEIFKEILKVTQLFGKYEISADKIYFSPAGEVTAYFDKARVSLGTDQNIDEKVMQLASILPELAGKSGVLHMENYDASTTKITFQPE